MYIIYIYVYFIAYLVYQYMCNSRALCTSTTKMRGSTSTNAQIEMLILSKNDDDDDDHNGRILPCHHRHHTITHAHFPYLHGLQSTVFGQSMRLHSRRSASSLTENIYRKAHLTIKILQDDTTDVWFARTNGLNSRLFAEFSSMQFWRRQ